LASKDKLQIATQVEARPRKIAFLRLADEISLPAFITIASPLSVRIMQG
jgi:hypothetical protein